jgi:hypothetical protein
MLGRASAPAENDFETGNTSPGDFLVLLGWRQALETRIKKKILIVYSYLSLDYPEFALA